jgi:ATP-dependent Lon protease
MTSNKEPVDFSPKAMPDSLPILPLFDTVLFPKMVLPLVVMQTDSIRLVDDAMSGDRMIGIVVSTAKEETEDEGAKTDIDDQKQRLYSIGTSALILKMAKTEDNRAQLLVQGVNRFEIGDYISESPYLRARVQGIEEEEREDTETKALMSNIAGLFNKVVSLSPGLPDEIASMSKTIKEPGVLADMVASVINAGLQEKQAVLETHDVKERLKKVSRMVNQQLEILELGNKIQTQVKGDMDKKQREYYLREQLKAIKEELGEKDEETVEIEEYRTKIEEAATCPKKPARKPAGTQTPGTHAPLFGRIHRVLHLLGLADRAAVAHQHHRQPGYQQGQAGAGR